MAKHLRITGLVQGVGYRASLAAQAQDLQLSGWVRNRRDGSVEAMAAGSAEALATIVTWARRGPPGSQVREVLIEDVTDTGYRPGHFDILPTA